jgi:hypothetical protein
MQCNGTGIEHSYGLDGRGIEVRVPVAVYFHLSISSRLIGSETHLASYLLSTGRGGGFLEVKRQGREADHSPPTSAEIKNMWIYTSTPPYVFMM